MVPAHVNVNQIHRSTTAFPAVFTAAHLLVKMSSVNKAPCFVIRDKLLNGVLFHMVVSVE